MVIDIFSLNTCIFYYIEKHMIILNKFRSITRSFTFLPFTFVSIGNVGQHRRSPVNRFFACLLFIDVCLDWCAPREIVRDQTSNVAAHLRLCVFFFDYFSVKIVFVFFIILSSEKGEAETKPTIILSVRRSRSVADRYCNTSGAYNRPFRPIGQT